MRVRDNSDAVLSRLDRLVNVLEAREFGSSSTSVTNNITESTTTNVDLAEPNEQNTPSYFSTGPRAKTCPAGEWTRIDFGLIAKTINIRSTVPVHVAFSRPENEGQIISLTTQDLPFTIGGPETIDAAFLWVQPPEDGDDADIQVIAYE